MVRINPCYRLFRIPTLNLTGYIFGVSKARRREKAILLTDNPNGAELENINICKLTASRDHHCVIMKSGDYIMGLVAKA